MTQAPDPARELVPQPAFLQRQRDHAELGRDEHRREQEQEPAGVSGQAEDETVPLEEVALAWVPAELVVVVDVGGRIDNHAQASKPGSPPELEILEVHEELLREATEGSEGLGTHRHRRAARRSHVAELRQRRDRLAVAAGPADPAHVHLGPGRVQDLRPIQQPESRHRDPDRRLREARRQRPQRAGRDDRVGVQEDEDVATRLPRTQVRTGREAEVFRRSHEPQAFPSTLAATVVDDNHLVSLAGKGLQAAPERRP